MRVCAPQVQHYGYEFLYGANTVDPDRHIGALPSWFDALIERIAALMPVPCALRGPRTRAYLLAATSISVYISMPSM